MPPSGDAIGDSRSNGNDADTDVDLADDPYVRRFVRFVVLANVAVFAIAVGLLLGVMRGRTAMAVPLVALGVAIGGYMAIRWPREADEFPDGG